jgi:RNA recognition motif-containing protein
MNTKIYFNNLPASVTENELTDLFSAYGNIVNVHIAADDRAGFVTMITPEGARTAIEALNGKVLSSGILTLSEMWWKGESPSSQSGPRRRASQLY